MLSMLKYAGLMLSLLVPLMATASESDIEKGRRIYIEGILPSGAILKGVRSGEDYSVSKLLAYPATGQVAWAR